MAPSLSPHRLGPEPTESYYQVYLTLSEEAPALSAFPRRAWKALAWAASRWLVAAATLGLVPGVCLSFRTLLRRRGPAGPSAD